MELAKSNPEQTDLTQEMDHVPDHNSGKAPVSSVSDKEQAFSNENLEMAAKSFEHEATSLVSGENQSLTGDSSEQTENARNITKNQSTLKEEGAEEVKDNQDSREADVERFSDDEEYPVAPSDDPAGIRKDPDNVRYELTHWTYHLKRAEERFSRAKCEASEERNDLWKSLLTFMCERPAAFNAWQKLQ